MASSTALLDEDDFALNRAAFAENGYSKGMFYNTYCNARVTLADGRVYVFGGHDMQSNNGLYKVNIFDPETETWVGARSPAPAQWASDPFGQALFARDPTLRSMTTAIPGTSRAPSRRNPPTRSTPLVSVGDSAAERPGARRRRLRPGQRRGTRSRPGGEGPTEPEPDGHGLHRHPVNQVVPEVYDPQTDRNIALENARMAFPLYPQLEVVQTGPGRDDWQVCTFNGEIEYGTERIPGGARFGVGGGTPPFTQGTTWCLDVLGAMQDPHRHIPRSTTGRWSTLPRRSGPTAARPRASSRLTPTGTRCRTSGS